MQEPWLTIGMAQCDDWESCYWTIQSLREYHCLDDCELLVIDSSRDCQQSRQMERFVNTQVHGNGNLGARWLKYQGTRGTSGPKNEVFAQANGRYVLCIDPHVQLGSGVVDRLLSVVRNAPNNTRDMVQGPLRYESRRHWSHCFVDVWRGEMWGVWANIWKHSGTKALFGVYEDQGRARVASLGMVHSGEQLHHETENLLASQGLLSGMLWHQHRRLLESAGCREFGHHYGDECVVAGMGMGMFCMRKESWPGFNPNFLGFGGEELYIHEKVRRAGGRCMVFNRLPWTHRFMRFSPPRYRNNTYEKIRNFVIGHEELGLDMNRIDEHVLRSKLLDGRDYGYLRDDPIGRTSPPGPPVTLTGT